ncbi:MAG: DUF2157 domain-containing protein [Leadbetterella sp.]
MYNFIFQKIRSLDIFSEEHIDYLQDKFLANNSFSLFWEVRILLGLGIGLLTGGLGTLIYKNIDSIGHQAIIAAMCCVVLLSGWFGYSRKDNFSWSHVANKNNLVDYALLIACTFFVMLLGYVQYQYEIFKGYTSFVAFFTGILLLFLGYYFDHRGVLVMGISGLGSALGLVVTPYKFWEADNFSSKIVTHINMGYGILLLLLGYISERYDRKKHFGFTYVFFGGNMAFWSILYALFNYDIEFLYFSVLMVLTFVSYLYARKTKSILFLVLGALYGYIGFIYFTSNQLFEKLGGESFVFAMYFYLACLGGMVYFFINLKKILGIKK